MKAYKLVTKYRGLLYGFNSKFNEAYSLFNVEYAPEIVSVPKFTGSKLFAFDTIQSAQNFFFVHDTTVQYELWEAEVELAKDTYRKIACHPAGVRAFWDSDIQDEILEKTIELKDSPEGTLFCESIKLTRQIRGNELYCKQ